MSYLGQVQFGCVMIDLETIAKKPNAAISSIGLVQFDINTGDVKQEIEVLVDIEDSMKYGIADGSTIKWWLDQSETARAHFNADNLCSLKQALMHVQHFFLSTEVKTDDLYVFGNGADFDNVILTNAFDSCGLNLPWNQYKNEHVRSLVNLGRALLDIDPKNEIKRDGEHHTSLSDAKHQVKYVCHIWNALKEATSATKGTM